MPFSKPRKSSSAFSEVSCVRKRLICCPSRPEITLARLQNPKLLLPDCIWLFLFLFSSSQMLLAVDTGRRFAEFLSVLLMFTVARLHKHVEPQWDLSMWTRLISALLKACVRVWVKELILCACRFLSKWVNRGRTLSHRIEVLPQTRLMLPENGNESGAFFNR